MICHYCGKDAVMVTGRTIYPNHPKLHSAFFYQCKPCDAYVGTHKNSQEPFGSLANKSLRALRMKCHKYFDRLWMSEEMKRYEAYSWLQDRMNMTADQAHIGKFDEDDCNRLLEILKKEGLM